MTDLSDWADRARDVVPVRADCLLCGWAAEHGNLIRAYATDHAKECEWESVIIVAEPTTF